ncbi:MAG: family oxidoreductase [Labilithrix sp.]|nr:family oxidoreductase [Labilithrix sp.]
MAGGFHDIVIVGSGFGGAVMAARLGAHAKTLAKKPSVLVLEKGWDGSGKLDPRSDGGPVNAQGNRFRHTLSPAYTSKVAQVFTDPRGTYQRGAPSMNVIAGKGFGGGSIVYDGVSLRAPAEAFEQVRDGRRLWPSFYSRAALSPYYAMVEQRLGVHRLAWTDASAPHHQLATKRDFVFAEGCRRIGATAVPLKLADAGDANEGWWNQGQRFEGRQDLTKNYLRDARDSGVVMWSGCEVEHVAPTKDGYVISGTDRRGGAAVPFEIECRVLVVAGGAVGSSGLLLRSVDRFGDARALDPAQMLGKQVSANGDYGVSGVVGRDYEHDVEGHKGKPMSSFCPSFFGQHKFVLIPFYAAPLYLALGGASTLLRPREPAASGRGSTGIARDATGLEERAFGLAYKKRLMTFGPRMLTMGCLAIDACEGEISLARSGTGCDVSWRETSATTEARWKAAVDAMRRIYEALGGEMYLDAYRKDGTVSTAHPLGGCRMTERGDAAGVVDTCGESLRNRNLFVVDAAVIPSALGVNPSLTIAAVAESIADRLIRGAGTEALADRLA